MSQKGALIVEAGLQVFCREDLDKTAIDDEEDWQDFGN